MRHWIKRIAGALARGPGQYPTAFSSLKAVLEDEVEAYDGVRQIKVPWASIERITAEMGHQQYDMTQTLTIRHSAGRPIFVSEGEVLWAPFIKAMLVHLQGALLPGEWMPHLSENPEAVIRVYRS